MSDTPRTAAAWETWIKNGCAQRLLLESQKLERELAEAKIRAARYEYLRKLNPREFAALTLFCNTSGIHFDTEVDRRRNQP